MIPARPNRPSVRNTCGFTLPELVVTLLIATVLIGAYIGAMDYNEAMKQWLRPPLRPNTTSQQAAGMRVERPQGEVGIAPSPLQYVSKGATESLVASRGATEATAPEAPAAVIVTNERAADEHTAQTHEGEAAQPPR